MFVSVHVCMCVLSPVQAGTASDRQLIFIDRNRDLYVMTVAKREPAKLASMVDSAAWHDSTGMLAAMVDQKLVSGHSTQCGTHTNTHAHARMRTGHDLALHVLY